MIDSLVAVLFLVLLFIGMPVVACIIISWTVDVKHCDTTRIKLFLSFMYNTLHHPREYKNHWQSMLWDMDDGRCDCQGEQQCGDCTPIMAEYTHEDMYYMTEEDEAYLPARSHCDEHHITRTNMTNMYGEPMQGYECTCTCGREWVAGGVGLQWASPYQCPTVAKQEQEATALKWKQIEERERKAKAKALVEKYSQYTGEDWDFPPTDFNDPDDPLF